ncbi:hypothetical protein ACO0QE_003170 [Hanseniaspora vineae]
MVLIDYITAFDTELNFEDRSDTTKQLLLYHVFPQKEQVSRNNEFSVNSLVNGSLLKFGGLSLSSGKFLELLQLPSDMQHKEVIVDTNEKLANIGMIQAMYNFHRDNFNSIKSDFGKADSSGSANPYDIMTIKLSSSRAIIVYNYQTSVGDQKKQNIFIALSCKYETNLQITALEKCLVKSIINFQFLYGPFELYYGKNIQFTHKLNEFYLPYWNNIAVIPKKDLFKLSNFQPDMHKVSEFSNSADLNHSLLNQVSAQIKNTIFSDQEYYLNIKDVLVYQFNEKERSYDGRISNFAEDNKSVVVISNWLENFIEQRKGLKLANINEKSFSETSGISKDQTWSNQHSEEPLTSKFMHNITLPFQFAYDAVQEVGNMTGVGSSISMIGDLIPRPLAGYGALGPSDGETNSLHHDISENSDGEGGGEGTENNDNKQDTSKKMLNRIIGEYKQETQFLKYFLDTRFSCYLQFGSYSERRFNILLWEYQDIYCVFIVEPEFDIIYEDEFLEILNDKFVDIFDRFNEDKDILPQQHDFSYCLQNFQTNKIFTSMPNDYSCLKASYEESLLKKSKLSQDVPLKKSSSLWGLGSIFGMNAAANKNADHSISDRLETEHKKVIDNNAPITHNVFYNIDESEFDSLNIFLWSTLSQCQRQTTYEKITKLENGILCYVSYKKGEYLLLVLKNWLLQPSKNKVKNCHKRNDNFKMHSHYPYLKMMKSMGPDVIDWWLTNEDTYFSAEK